MSDWDDVSYLSTKATGKDNNERIQTKEELGTTTGTSNSLKNYIQYGRRGIQFEYMNLLVLSNLSQIVYNILVFSGVRQW